MSLPHNHSCDHTCDYEDEEHKELRLRKYRCARVKAESSGDQAWAQARDMLPMLLRVQKKLDTGASIVPDDIKVIYTALSLVIGEIYLRKSHYNNF